MRGYQWSKGTRELDADRQTRRRYDAHAEWATRGSEKEARRKRQLEVSGGKSFKDMSREERKESRKYVQTGYGEGWGSSSGGGGGAAPTMGAAPELNLPEYDEGKVSALTQKKAAPSIRRLRETTQQATAATYDNPNVKRMTVRDALQGYGTGLEGVIAGAGKAASAEYGQQYAASVSAEMAKYQGALNRQSQEYEVASRNWLMGRQTENWKDRQDYDSDPYAAFDAFYG